MKTHVLKVEHEYMDATSRIHGAIRDLEKRHRVIRAEMREITQ